MCTTIIFDKTFRSDDVLKCFSGLRVLPGGEGIAFTKSRDTRLELDRSIRPRVLTIYGGKLTSYRATSEKIIKRLQSKDVLPVRKKQADTRRLLLPEVD